MTDTSAADQIDLNDPAAVERAEQAAWDELTSDGASEVDSDQNPDNGTGRQRDDANEDNSATDQDGDRGPAAHSDDDQGQASDGDEGGQAGGSDQDGEGADPWATAPEPLRAEYETLQKRLSGQDRTIKKLIQQRDQARRTSPRQADKGGTATDQRPKGFSTEQWKRLQDDFPEVADAFKAELSARDAELEQLRGTVGGLSEAEAQRQIDSNEAALRERHPDFLDVVATTEWADWLQAQPDYVRQAIERNGNAIVDPDEAADVIDRFKSSQQRAGGTGAGPGAAQAQTGRGTGTTFPGKRERQKESAATGHRSGGPRLMEGEPGPNADEDQLFDHFNRDYVKRRAAG